MIPGFELQQDAERGAVLNLSGDWSQGQTPVEFGDLRSELNAHTPRTLVVNDAGLGTWDSILMAFLLQCHNYCQANNIEFDTLDLPDSAQQLLRVATTVPPHERPPEATPGLWASLNPSSFLHNAARDIVEALAFFGDVAVGMGRLATGKANTRFADFRQFCYQAGPDAFAIITLTSVLVGMILAYLGAVQLKQFGAEIYVANLVTIGMLREMGVLMTAIVMAGRTGAAYAAQLGTMQTNEEIDAITTMGVSPVEFLVLPRMLALIVMMPLLAVYADVLGIIGGGIVAGGMGITFLQYLSQTAASLSLVHFGVGLLKSLVFAILIAIAGCRSGINSGRSSAAVGQAATEAVVTALVYLIVADAAINILFQALGI